MQKPIKPLEEEKRLAELLALKVLDTRPEERFDRITRMAQRMFNVPIVFVSLVDSERQWFKSKQGLEVHETARHISFCGHAILSECPLIVEDATADKRFFDNPLVTESPHIRFYAGVPLHGPEGARIGAFCIVDHVPRTLSTADIGALSDFAAWTESELASSTLAESTKRIFVAEAKLQAVVDNVIDAILIIDEHGTIEAANAGAERMFGYLREEIVGHTIRMLLPACAHYVAAY